MMYDELWAEHYKISTGVTIKPFKDRYKRGGFKQSDSFVEQKPQVFKNYDQEFWDYYRWNTIVHLSQVNQVIKWADARMAMGDFRYGPITRQNLDNYDVVSEFYRRINIARETRNLEYIVDAYNMLRIQSFKNSKVNTSEKVMILIRADHIFKKVFVIACRDQWELISIDDGIHAKEK